MQQAPIFIISAAAVAGVIIRPFKISEYVWIISGVFLLLLLRLINFTDVTTGVSKGFDVYLFLTGMMLLAETAREVKLFDWLAAHATNLAKGSASRLFLLIYLVGVLVTMFLSNDATAVVLTPAVAAAVKAAKIQKPLPYLLICAFIANAASFVLPISNPANLVIYGAHMPSLLNWLRAYIIPSIAAITATFFLLRFSQRKELVLKIERDIVILPLSKGGKTALYGMLLTAILLLAASSLNMQLGLAAAITGVLTSLVVVISSKKNPLIIIKGVSWSVLPLVAGLFIIVEALSKTHLISDITHLIQHTSAKYSIIATWGSGIVTAVVCNLINNLPAGLIAGTVLQNGHVSQITQSAVLIGIDLGPNLSITGSLATILWIVALRRENQTCSAWTFLKLGSFIMTLSLIAALASLWL